VKVNWIKSIACGLGLAGLSTMPQIVFAQQGKYVPPSTWNNFHPNAAPQQRSSAPQVDTESPQYSTASAPVTRFQSQQLQTPQMAAQPQYNYAAPPSLTAPQANYDAPSYSVARRNDQPTMLEGGLPSPAGAMPMEQLPHAAPLASEQFYGHAQPAPGYNHAPSPYMEAASAPWEGSSSASESCGSGMAGGFVGGDCGPVRPPLFPWFGGGNVLFWTMANNTNHRLVLETGMPSTTLLNTRQVDPDNGIGYDVFFGRYFGCGQYAVSFNYLNFDPDAERAMFTGMPPGHYLSMPAFQNIGYYADATDPGSAYVSMEDTFDAMPNIAIDRDVSFQGVELNFWSFGFGGARRLAPAYGTGLACGFQNPFGQAGHAGAGPNGACGPACPPRRGYGGFGGPLERPCAGSTQLALSQGFRWFQFNDDFRLSADNGVAQSMFDSNAQNDMFGYQVGGRWNYCVSRRINLGIGARFGAYGNNVEVMQRVGNSTMPARYQSATPASRRFVDQRDRATVLSGLGEIDLGTGFRMTDCWTIRGGYRVLGVSGVATSVGMIKHEMFSENLNAAHEANDSVLLHGAYIGSEFNW